VYGNLGKTNSIISTAAAHHRLRWMHPFMDGNGRVARLMPHAMLLDLLDTGAVWSVSRGLARNVREYKALLANCDMTRRNDLDGRGTLSEEALAEFTRFFLRVCSDQVTFMEGLMQPDRVRVVIWAEEEIRLGRLPVKSGGSGSGALSRRTASRRRRRRRRHRRAPGPPHRIGVARQRGAHIRQPSRASAPCIPRIPCIALDAGVVSRQTSMIGECARSGASCPCNATWI